MCVFAFLFLIICRNNTEEKKKEEKIKLFTKNQDVAKLPSWWFRKISQHGATTTRPGRRPRTEQHESTATTTSPPRKKSSRKGGEHSDKRKIPSVLHGIRFQGRLGKSDVALLHSMASQYPDDRRKERRETRRI